MDQQHDNCRDDRREFLRLAALGATGLALAGSSLPQIAAAQTPDLASNEQLPSRPASVKVLMPCDKVPLSFVIDDSTCLVNMGHFCTPQFATAWPTRDEYKKPWRTWPREIPDSFVREFGQWCADQGVKGKYSIVPNPACVGWMDRELPGWSRADLQDSLKLVRELMVPNWDIHPEMITHTRVIDLKTGRPFQDINAGTMENSYPQEKKSVDELAAYLAYALRILKNCDLPCEGITTPGGFGNAVKSELSLAVDEALKDVYQVDLPHYFKYVNTGDQITEPKLEHLRGVGTDDLRLTMNVPAGTGDWFGGWQGDRISEGDRYANADATSGRMVELIQRRQPAVMLCHWPGMYSNGTHEGFHTFQRIVRSLAARFGDATIWMKMSEMARYWAAKQLTEVKLEGNRLLLDAPFATQRFTLQISGQRGPLQVRQGDSVVSLRKVSSRSALEQGTWIPNATASGDASNHSLIACFDLRKGKSIIEFA